MEAKSEKHADVQRVISTLRAIKALGFLAAAVGAFSAYPMHKHYRFNQALEIPTMVECADRIRETYGEEWTYTLYDPRDTRVYLKKDAKPHSAHSAHSGKWVAMQAMRYCDHNRRVKARETQEASGRSAAFRKGREDAKRYLIKKGRT